MASPEKGAAAAAAAAVVEDGGEGEAVRTMRRPGRFRVVHPDVAEFLSNFRRLRTNKPKPATATATPPDAGDGEKRARYGCAFQDEDEGFAPGRMVWGKVRSHPWWPGQVFDAADASELALVKQPRRKSGGGDGAVLVAFFWDNTFAWLDAGDLRPFRGDFARLAAGDGEATTALPTRALAASVDAALAEVARRVGVGLTCCCAAANAGLTKQQVIENAGVREGAYGASADAAFARGVFRGEAIVGYVSALAVAPLAGADRLDLAVATAQLEALGRWRCGGARSLLPVYTCHYGIEARRKRRRPRKNSVSCNVDDDAELELENFEPTPQPLSHQMSTKIGKLMSRAAQQMSQSPPAMIHRDNNNNNNNTNCNDPAMSLTMARCTRPADHDESPCLKNDPFLAGLVLHFICPSAVLPAGELVKIFCQFGPIMEAKTENSYALVMFKRRADAEAAFAGTAKIDALRSSLISFRLTYSMLPSSPIDPPESTLNNGNDHLDF